MNTVSPPISKTSSTRCQTVASIGRRCCGTSGGIFRRRSTAPRNCRSAKYWPPSMPSSGGISSRKTGRAEIPGYVRAADPVGSASNSASSVRSSAAQTIRTAVTRDLWHSKARLRRTAPPTPRWGPIRQAAWRSHSRRVLTATTSSSVPMGNTNRSGSHCRDR